MLISILGSHGDTLPFIALGRALRRRGHEVRLYGNALFTALVGSAGLAYVETSDAGLLRQALADPRVTDSRQGMSILAQGVIGSTLDTYEAMSLDAVAGQTLLVGSTLSFAPRLLAEVRRLPFAGVHLSPSVFRSEFVSPRVTALGHLARWPRFVKRALWFYADRRLLDPLFTAPLNEIRRGLGLPDVQHVMGRWLHQGAVDLALFPAWFAPPQPDWPANAVLAGFPLAGDDDREALPAGLAAFLAAGPPPVVFTAGTANTQSEAFYAESVAACARLGLRGVMAAQRRGQLPPALPDGVLHVSYVPFKDLFRHACVVVHHGGIGTMSEALRAGVPQLVRPMAYDQFDNASRAVALGVARELSTSAYRGARLDATLANLAGSEAARRACAAVAARMNSEDGLGAACAALIAAFDASVAAGY